MTIAYFGGAFSPPHVGHLVIAERVCEARGYERVDLLVSGQPPHAEAKFAIEAKHRVAMAKLAVQGNAVLGVDDREVRHEGKSYTIDTARELIKQGVKRPAFIIGGDMLADLPTWHEINELLKIAEFIPVLRPGFGWDTIDTLRAAFGDKVAKKLMDGCVKVPLMQISSTEIRDRIRAGKSVRYLVSDAVIEYALANKLYA
jgi:nicotinate-nucleotide adenylyltransferase